MQRIMYIIISILASLCVVGSIYAQEPGLEHIRVRFCNDDTLLGGTKTVTLTGDAQTNFELCLYVFNMYTEPVDVAINLVDGAITNDAMQNKACKDEMSKDAIGQYAVFSGDQTVFTIPGKTFQQTAVSLKLPDYYAGKYYGCITAQIAKQKQEKVDGMFAFVNRLGYPFEIIMDGDLRVDFAFQDFDNDPVDKIPGYEIFGHTKQLTLVHKGLDMYLYAVAHNMGNIPQQATITGSLRIWEGYPRETQVPIEGFQQEIISDNSMEIYLDAGLLPQYGGPVTLDMVLASEPILDFESENITEDMRKPTSTTVQATLRAMPPFAKYVPYIMGILILWLVVYTMMPSKKSHKSQEETVTLTMQEYESLKKAKKDKKKAKKKAKKKDKKNQSDS